MKNLRLRWLFTFVLFVLFASPGFASDAVPEEKKEDYKQIFSVSNELVKYFIVFEEGKLISDRLEVQPEWLSEYRTRPFLLETDADFGLNVMWTGWRAPGNVNNAENPIMLSKHNFELVRHEIQEAGS